jgi:glucose-1-phosphate adenylyltransferase
MSVMAMILAGGESPALSVLTADRSEAAVPFGGKYRIIDFTLSNCVNSGIFNVAVLTQYQPRSLNEHIGVGRPWDLDRSTGGVRLLQPYQSSRGERGAWQEGNADAIRFNMDVLRDSTDEVLILAGDHVYVMDYNPMLRFHREHDADVTLATRAVPTFEAYRYGMVTTDANGQVTEFEEKPRRTASNQASMGIYVFKREVLADWLTGPGKRHRDLGRDVLPAIVAARRVYAYPFQSYWADAGTIQAYYEANMSLLAEKPGLDLYDPNWVIHTRSEERPGALIGATARVDGNLLSDGCRVEGTVSRSIISPGVYIAPGAVVRDSIIMTDAVIEEGAQVERAILDKRVRVEAGARLGWGDDNTPNQEHPDRLNTGITLVGKRAIVPAGVTVGRNVVIHPRVTKRSYPGTEVASGETIGG